MARLCRLHFAGMGEACARFHPLTLDFRQPATGTAQDSVLWLRNGGGKTTLISLFYSTLVPNQNYFLGKLLKKGTSVANFLRLNELGVIVTEWDFPALGARRRVVGQVLLLKEHDLKRRYFSFAASPGFGFEQLPVLGLGKPVRSIENLLDELREAEQRHPGMDLVIPEDQTDWELHLERIGLDPFLFQMHLKMNMQEGGASDLFKLKAPEDFLRLFLELVFDERATEELEKSLTELREKIARAPDRQAAIEFGEELLKSLRPFATEAGERERLRGQQEDFRREMAAVASAIRDLLCVFDADEASRIEELEKWTKMLADLKTKREQHQRYARGYERLGREYLIEETKLTWELAREAEGAAKRRAQLLTAAIAHRIWARKQAELNACVKQLESLLREHRPEWERVRALGAHVQSAWKRQVAALLSAQIEATAQRKTATDELRTLQNVRTELTGKHAKATADREAADAALTKHDTARGRLVDREVIEARESGSRARERWATKVADAEAAASKLRAEATELRAAVTSVIAARNETAQQLNERERELAQIRQTIDHAGSLRARVSALPAVRELCEGVEPDLRNPHLAPNLDAVAEAADTKLIELGMAAADDERSLRQLDRDGLLAPALDLEAVLRRVHEAGARTALPLYRWLAEHRTAAEALDLLRTEPAAYSGILVQNAADLEKARAAVQSLSIKTPVLLVTLEALSAGRHGAGTGTHTILPSEHGLFSTKEAALARPCIEERRGTRDTEREAQSMRAQQARDAASRVREFATTWPQTRIDELERAVDSSVEAVSALNSALASLTARVGGLQSQEGENQRAQLQNAGSLELAKGFVRELDTFVADHESHADRWRDLRELSLTQLDTIGDKLTTLAGQEPRLVEQAENANQRWLELSGDLSAARTRLAELPQEYLGEPGESPDDDRPAAEVEPEFRAAIASYEGKVQKGEIEGRITELRGTATELHREFEKQKGSTDEAEIIRESRRPALDADASQQKETVIAACAATLREKENYDAALKQKPEPREFKAGTDTHPEVPRPATSEACSVLAAKMQTVASTAAEELQQAQQHTEQIERAIARIRSRRPSYRTQLDRLGKTGEATVVAHAEFSDNDEANFALVQRVCRRAEETHDAHEKVEKSMRRRFDTAMHPLITGERFSKRVIPFRERLQRLTFEDFATQAQRHVRGIEEQVKGCQEELDTQEQEKRILIQKLDVVARQAANLFDQAARVSEMPESMGPWARQPFLRITLPRKNDPTERHVLLGQTVDRWFQPAQNIPRGAELAYQCLLALCGTKSANVRILKPEYNLRAASHDIMALVQEFSDGEKLTTAIVLYCILVRLRARQKARAEHIWESDAGLLLLDNPFGKATLATFVDLQLRMARQMGVQLIYATGVSDFGALKAFPHYVRLRNSSRGRATGDYHVTADSRSLDGEGAVEGVTVGFQRNGDLKASDSPAQRA